MLAEEDKALWDAFSKTVTPLGKQSRFKILTTKIASKFLFVRKPVVDIPFILDLHGFTLEEGHSIFVRFLNRHCELGSRRVVIITGKGREGKGALKAEFPFWLETPEIAVKISSVREKYAPEGGAFELRLKQRNK